MVGCLAYGTRMIKGVAIRSILTGVVVAAPFYYTGENT